MRGSRQLLLAPLLLVSMDVDSQGDAARSAVAAGAAEVSHQVFQMVQSCSEAEAPSGVPEVPVVNKDRVSEMR